MNRFCAAAVTLVVLTLPLLPATAQPPADPLVTKKELKEAIDGAASTGDTAWMLVSTALVLFMVPGLCFFMAAWFAKKMSSAP